MPPFLKICVPFIPNIDAHTSTQSEVNHVGSCWKCSKKILAALALAGGAAMLGRGKGMSGKETISDAQKAHNFGSPVSGVTYPNEGIAKAKLDALASGSDQATTRIKRKAPGTNYYISPGKTIQDSYYEKGAMPKVDLNPYKYNIPKPNRLQLRKSGGRITASKGGRVTGIAKRGFGRALMKGKK